MRGGLTVACLAVLLMIGCTKGPAPAPPTPDEGRSKAVSVPAYPRDQVVLQVLEGGGMMLPDRTTDRIPDVTIWGDGRVVFAAPDDTVREGRLAPEALDRLVAAATFLYGLQESYDAAQHTDAGSAVFTVLTDQGRQTVSVYGLNPDQPQDGGPHAVLFAQMGELWRLVHAALPPDAPEMAPRDVWVTTTYTEATDAAAEWPADLQGNLTGDAARRAVALGGLGKAKTFSLDGKPQGILVVPALPSPGSWDIPDQQTHGQGADEKISVDAWGRRRPDGAYDVTVTIENKAEHGVKLLYNCGTLLWLEGIEMPVVQEQDTACPGESGTLLEAGQSTHQHMTLGTEVELNWDALAVSVRYEVSGSPSPAQSVTARLKP